MKKLQITSWQLSLLAAVFMVVVNNSALAKLLGERLDLLSLEGFGFLLAIMLFAVFILNTFILTFGIGALQKPLIATLLVASSIFGYFTNNLGVVSDAPMILNMAETVHDRNTAEAFELLSLPLTLHVLGIGVVPALVLLLSVEVRQRRLISEIGVRVLAVITVATFMIATIVPNYKFISFFARENNELVLTLTPIYPMASLFRIAKTNMHENIPFTVIDSDATQSVSFGKRTVGIMVVGETARVDRFSMNGYARETNALLEAKEGVLFARGTSCGTSTLFSVPCMFSMRGRENYTPKNANTESNVLDILSAAGVDTVWIDNNSSCKGVCARIDNVNLRHDLDSASPFYSDGGYFDEILVGELDPYLGSAGPDLLIVLHTLGSHGPAYSRRYPSQFSVFSPSCNKVSPTECSDAEVTNAYDNTILYTDYVLSRIIEELEQRSDEFDGFVFYASDHGESLGENGMYLHGLPYAFAPDAQKNVPFVVWLSAGFRERQNIDARTIEQFGHVETSHDSISHTLLGFFDVDATSYDASLDLFAPPVVQLVSTDTADQQLQN